MDFNKMPKLIADQFHLNNNQQWFFVGFSSGTRQDAFLLPPAAAKGLALELDKKIKAYETQFGPIDTSNLQVGIQSPFNG